MAANVKTQIKSLASYTEMKTYTLINRILAFSNRVFALGLISKHIPKYHKEEAEIKKKLV